MQQLNIQKLAEWYSLHFENKLKGRRILYKDIAPIIEYLPKQFKKEILGYSEQNIPIYKISIGEGEKRILCWTQMHGNESTGTKAVFDLFKWFQTDNHFINKILTECTLVFIPLLNPDGAIKFTRENVNNIDLNRDAVDKKAVESRLLRGVLDKFNPHFCFNMHDQRSIFSVEGTSNPATISFLAPSEDAEQSLTEGRKETMSVIVAMNNFLQKIIPNQIGRYTAEFYPTATGDNFQKLGHNTILIESGHFKHDLERDISRKFTFLALIQGIYYIASENNYTNYKPYFEIPNNSEMYLDIIYKNNKIIEGGVTMVTDIGIQKKFKVKNDELVAYDFVENTGDLSNYYSDYIIDAQNMDVSKFKLSNS